MAVFCSVNQKELNIKPFQGLRSDDASRGCIKCRILLTAKFSKF